MSDGSLNPPQQMIRLAMAFISARAIYAAAKLGVADGMDERGAPIAELAARRGLDPAALERLLRALSSVGVVRCDANGCFALTPLGATLRRDGPESVRDYVVYAHEFLYELFRGLDGSVRTGRPAVEDIFGAPLFDYLQSSPEKGALFHAGLGNRGRIEAPAILDAFDFAGCRRVVDLGGGNGAFLSAILARQPAVSGVLLERAPAVAAARAGEGGPLPRCELIEGDYFRSVPPDGDVYVLKRVLFDHDDHEVRHILENCRAAMATGGRVLIIEGLVAPANRPGLAHLMDLTFLVATTGRMRTREEYATLLQDAGLRLTRVLPTQSDVSVLEAVRA
jgi:hypothetical protein